MGPTGKGSEKNPIFKLAEDGRNWKTYRAKYLEVAATECSLSIVAGWESDDGTKDWEHQAGVARMLFLITIPTLLRRHIRQLRTAQEIFKYFAKLFGDSDPIEDPRVKKLATSANKVERAGTAAECPKKLLDASHGLLKRPPMKERPRKNGYGKLEGREGGERSQNTGWRHESHENTATKWHASTERDKEVPNTKDLPNQGTKNVDDANIGWNDPHLSTQMPVTGSSATCTETTDVVLKGKPHETQHLQNSLQVTPQRLSHEDKPSECEQEVVESVVTAWRTIPNGMGVEAAKPMVVNIDRTAVLGRDLAMTACRIDEGAKMEHKDLHLHKLDLRCNKDCQCSENANANIPSAYGVPLEGKWSVCASGKTSDSNGDTNAMNAAVERIDGSGESTETEDTREANSESCEREMSVHACVDGMDSNPGWTVEREDTLNELTHLLTTMVKPYVEDGTTSVCICLGASHWHVSDANGPGHGTDGTGIHADALSGHRDVPSIEKNAIKPANATEIVRTSRKKEKPPDLPVEAARCTPDVSNGDGNFSDTSNAHADVHSVRYNMETAENEAESIRTLRIGWRTQNSPFGMRIEMSGPIKRWKRVSANNINVYALLNAPIDTPSRSFVFGQVEGGDELIVARDVEGKRAGDGDSNRGEDGEDDTTSSGHINSNRVEKALLAGDSQYQRQGRRKRNGDLPVSSVPHTSPTDRPYRLVRCRRQHGRIKIESVNVSTAQEDKMAYLDRACTTQTHGSEPKHTCGVHRPRHRRGRIKIAPINVSRMPEDGNTYLRCVNALQSMRRPRKQIGTISKLTVRCRMQGECQRDVEDHG